MSTSSPKRSGSAQVLALSAVLLLPVALFASKGVSVLFVFCALGLLIDVVVNKRSSMNIGKIGWMLLAFAALSALSAVWSLTPLETLKTSGSLLLTFVLGYSIFRGIRQLNEVDQNYIGRALFVGGIIGYGLLGIEIFSAGFLVSILYTAVGKGTPVGLDLINVFKPVSSIAALYLWPWGLYIYRRYSLIVAGFGVALASLIIFFSNADAAIVAILIGFLALAGTKLLKTRTAPVYGATVIVVMFIMPMWPGSAPNPLVSGKDLTFLSNSAIHRISIWQTSARHIADKPLFGHGFDTSRALYGPNSKTSATFLPDVPDRTWTIETEPIPLHPHNIALQVWLELGVVGIALISIFWMAIMNAINKVAAGRLERGVCYGLFASAMFIANVSFGAWQTWWLSALFLTSGLTTVLITKNLPSINTSNQEHS